LKESSDANGDATSTVSRRFERGELTRQVESEAREETGFADTEEESSSDEGAEGGDEAREETVSFEGEGSEISPVR